ncbi:MAG: glutathione S-transferase family protein [Rhizobiales bacterium]|nr:glutathione S-transferase family protein [Hyphomicrobiales bacterium]
MRIFGDRNSGNCLKVKWTADHLGLDYTWVDVDVMKGESRTPAYLARFSQGQVPAVVLDDGRCLAQSNGIMRFLARGSGLLPDDPFAQAKVDEWLFWEQNSHEFFVAGARFQRVYLGKPAAEVEPWRMERGNRALDQMEKELTGREWFAAGRLTIADIALLTYTRVAQEGGFDLAGRPAVRQWIARCESALGVEL